MKDVLEARLRPRWSVRWSPELVVIGEMTRTFTLELVLQAIDRHWSSSAVGKRLPVIDFHLLYASAQCAHILRAVLFAELTLRFASKKGRLVAK
jgi:hypothetical protein